MLMRWLRRSVVCAAPGNCAHEWARAAALLSERAICVRLWRKHIWARLREWSPINSR